MMDFQHIVIEDDGFKNFIVSNKHSGEEIAVIYFFPRWKKYVIEAYEKVVFDVSCLKDIIAFMEQLE